MNKLKKTIFGIILSCILLMGILYTFQEKLIFLPEEIQADYQYNFAFDFDEVNLRTEDNQTINALHIKSENPKGIILFFHGSLFASTKRGGLRRNKVAPFLMVTGARVFSISSVSM